MRFGTDDIFRAGEGKRWRTLFLSDVHLGSRVSRGERLIEFLRYHDADTLYLVGDIIDGWRLKSNWYWPDAHNEVLRELLRIACAGRKVIYVPGNHDEFLRDYCGVHFGGIEIAASAVHDGADGRRYLVVHGDECDRAIKSMRRLANVGYRANVALLALTAGVNHVRRQFGLSESRLPQRAKRKFKETTSYLADFQKAIAALAQRHEADGVICGHVHHAAIHEHLGVRYINCGDWVESCTAIAEGADGQFEILRWVGAAASNAESPRTTQARAA